MNMNEYQDLAQTTANKTQERKLRLAVAGLGITGEAGEVADLIKKNLGHGHQLDPEALKKELGDVLWYVQEVAYLAGFTLEEIAQANIQKLADRYPEGFSEYRSQHRTDL